MHTRTHTRLHMVRYDYTEKTTDVSFVLVVIKCLSHFFLFHVVGEDMSNASPTACVEDPTTLHHSKASYTCTWVRYQTTWSERTRYHSCLCMDTESPFASS